MKYCLRCKTNKSIDCFGFKKKGGLIRATYCKKCRSSIAQNWTNNNNAKVRTYKSNTKEGKAEYSKKYRNKNDIQVRIYGQLFQLANRDKHILVMRKYRIKLEIYKLLLSYL